MQEVKTRFLMTRSRQELNRVRDEQEQEVKLPLLRHRGQQEVSHWIFTGRSVIICISCRKQKRSE